jgi:hypothetical protein
MKNNIKKSIRGLSKELQKFKRIILIYTSNTTGALGQDTL